MAAAAPGGAEGARPLSQEVEAFSLVRGDRLIELQRKVGLVPAGGLGVGRRALFWALVTWLPMVVWAVVTGRALPGLVAEPMLQHFGVHVRCLVAIPALIVAEAVAHAIALRVIPHFVSSGLVGPAERPRFEAIIRQSARLRDAWLPWVLIGGVVLGWTIASPTDWQAQELSWATDAPAGQPPGWRFGRWWFLVVVRPVFMALLLAWIWRLAMVIRLFWRISRLPLQLVPTHPDRAAGLGFLEATPMMFALLGFSLSSVIGAEWGHQIRFHGAHAAQFQLPFAVFAVAFAVLALLPLIAFAPVLGRAKRRALLEYGALVGEHGRLVRRRWIQGDASVDSPLLSAPEIGPVADAVSMYDAVARLRPAPMGRRALVTVALPLVVPMLPVVALDVPIGDVLLKLIKTLI